MKFESILLLGRVAHRHGACSTAMSQLVTTKKSCDSFNRR